MGDARRFTEALASVLQLAPASLMPAYEDVYYSLWQEGTLPVGEDPLDPIVLAPGFDPGTAPPEQQARYTDITSAIDRFADALGSIVAHETGHALHGLLSDVTYESLGGTAVPRDFVEFGSQIMENWMGQPDVMRMYAKHYRTGEVIPDELIDKLQASGTFNQGFISVE